MEISESLISKCRPELRKKFTSFGLISHLFLGTIIFHSPTIMPFFVLFVILGGLNSVHTFNLGARHAVPWGGTVKARGDRDVDIPLGRMLGGANLRMVSQRPTTSTTGGKESNPSRSTGYNDAMADFAKTDDQLIPPPVGFKSFVVAERRDWLMGPYEDSYAIFLTLLAQTTIAGFALIGGALFGIDSLHLDLLRIDLDAIDSALVWGGFISLCGLLFDKIPTREVRLIVRDTRLFALRLLGRSSSPLRATG